MSNDENSIVVSFKMNGTLINGNQFTMLDEDVVITDVEIAEYTIIESEHPYPNDLDNKIYGEKTFEGTTALTVIIDQEIWQDDYLYLYDHDGNLYIRNSPVRSKTTIPGNYIKIVLTSASNYTAYGFRAIIIPNY